MFSFKEWAGYILSCMSECQNQDHGYYNLIFNISRELESNTQAAWTIVIWNIFKCSPCSGLENPFRPIIRTPELPCHSEMWTWVIEHKVKQLC